MWKRNDPYSIADLAGDAVAILDVLDIRKAHLVGLSLGGMIAQQIAINQPDRVASLTLMLTSGFIGDPDLPGMTSRYVVNSLLKGLPLFKYRIMGGEKNRIKERVATTIIHSGYEGLNIREIAEMVLYELRERPRTNLKAAWRHHVAATISGSRYAGLKKLNIPTLVIHGTADQLIPVAHGKKLVESIPNARGIWIEGIGHVFPLPDMDDINQQIMSHMQLATQSTGVL